MTPTEAVLLTRYVKACCPQQHIDDYTPDAWCDVLGDLDLEACKAAAAAVARRQPFVAPAEIRAEIRRVRDERIAREALPAPADELADDPATYKRALEQIVARVADGEMPFRAIEGGKPRAEPTEEFKAARSRADRDRVMSQTVGCPVEWCPALPGEPCRPGQGVGPLTGFHPSRLEAAREDEAS
jgi:hypothetical protein